MGRTHATVQLHAGGLTVARVDDGGLHAGAAAAAAANAAVAAAAAAAAAAACCCSCRIQNVLTDAEECIWCVFPLFNVNARMRCFFCSWGKCI